ncbi:MAG: class I SAM-dependent methyltransferase, partial [Clostridia bacterium]|nr:class I SAM-dependent methyltransferase [Clostridia bacterium]
MKILEEALEKLNIPFDESVIKSFEEYMDGILEWNEKINLTAITDKNEFISKHFIDSILGYNFEEYTNADSVIDIGTGAGFPGVPLAIVSPDKSFVLADSLNKRLKVINDLTS